MNARRDAVVIGGGHNGLVAAAYLAKQGLDTLVCERREVTGGAAVSEHPFGPEYTVTSLSYVVSLLPPGLVRDLQLDRHGYHVYPQGPYFAPRADGRYLRLPDDPAARHEEIAKFSVADADAYDGYEAHLARIGQRLGPLLHQIPPHLGSQRPVDLWQQARLLGQLRGVDERASVDVTRLLTGSIADLLDRYFSSDAVRGVLSVSGVIGTWAGPRSAGTAYVMLHHHVGEADGQSGAWGFPRGGMGGGSAAIAAAARALGGASLTEAGAAGWAGSAPRSRPRPGRAGRRSAPTPRWPGSGPGTARSSGSRWPAARRSTPTSSSPPRTRRSRSCACWTRRTCHRTSWPTSAPGRPAAARSRSTWPWTGCRSSPATRTSTRRCTGARSCWPRAWTTWRTRYSRPWPGSRRSCRSPTSASRACSMTRWPRPAR